MDSLVSDIPRKTYKKGIIVSSILIVVYWVWLLVLTVLIYNRFHHPYPTRLESLFSVFRDGSFYLTFAIINYLLLIAAGVSLILLIIFLVLRSGRYQQWKRRFQQRRIARQEQKEQQVTTTAIVQEPIRSSPPEPKSRLTAFLLCFFLGDFGAHRFYVGRTKSAVLWLLTLGLLNIGSFVDLIMILSGSFRDAQGNLLIEWDPASSKASVSPASSPPPPSPVSSPQEVEVLFCPHCSAKNLASQQFCGTCGERLAPTTR
ncbi:MAG: NINE protein [Candidatus Heimdallarchaeota archaeon]